MCRLEEEEVIMTQETFFAVIVYGGFGFFLGRVFMSFFRDEVSSAISWMRGMINNLILKHWQG